MRKIDKNFSKINSTKYKDWVNDLESKKKKHPTSRTYYDDVVMELYKYQNGVCAYTERYICPESLYSSANWTEGKYIINHEEEYRRTDHAGQLEHFNPDLKENQYWLWDNFFMIDSTINNRKSDISVINYLKPDLDDYSPEKYFDYDEVTHLFIPNTDIEDAEMISEIIYMIDEVLYLNHGVIRNDRRDFINDIKLKIRLKEPYRIDRFFTSVQWCL